MNLGPRTSLEVVVTLLAFILVVPAVINSDNEPDLNGVLVLHGRFSVAHACPVSQQWALTSGHVTDPKPFDMNVSLVPYRFESYNGEKGVANPQSVYTSIDLGWLYLSIPVSTYYKIGSQPAIGDKVYWVNFKINRDNFHQKKVRNAEVVNVIAGYIYTKGDDPEPGASGGCLLDRKGELIGIVTAQWINEDRRIVGGFVGVHAPWTPIIPEVEDAKS